MDLPAGAVPFWRLPLLAVPNALPRAIAALLAAGAAYGAISKKPRPAKEPRTCGTRVPALDEGA